jgi:hypothetical protein
MKIYQKIVHQEYVIEREFEIADGQFGYYKDWLYEWLTTIPDEKSEENGKAKSNG